MLPGQTFVTIRVRARICRVSNGKLIIKIEEKYTEILLQGHLKGHLLLKNIFKLQTLFFIQLPCSNFYAYDIDELMILNFFSLLRSRFINNQKILV